MIRPATVDDLPLLPMIERAAGELFRPLGMDAVADDESPDPAALRRFVDAGRAWVAERPSVVAYLLAEIVDGCAHVEQVTVHPAHAGHRIGAALLEPLGSWAARRGLPALTLTTFRHVPWNGPYYRRLGFRWIDDHEIGPGLQAVRDIETARGLDRWSRGCMRRELAIMSRRSSSTSRPREAR